MAMIRSLFWSDYNERPRKKVELDKKPSVWNWDDITNVLALEVLLIEIVNAREDVILSRAKKV